MVQIIPGVDEYIRPGIEKLGNTISLFTETDRRTQRAIRNMLLENPDLVQQFVDLEYKTPGSLKKLGFGSVADMVSKVGPSFELQKEQRLGEKQLDVEESSLGIQQMQNQMRQDVLRNNPNLTPEQASAAVANMMGAPTEGQLEREGYETDKARYDAAVADRIRTEMEEGAEAEGPMWNYVSRFRDGLDNPAETAAIIADPIKNEQFWRLFQLQNEREARLLSESGNEPTRISDLPVRVQDIYTSISPVRQAMGSYALKMRSFMSKSFMDRVKAAVGTRDEQLIVGQLESLRSGLMGTLRPLLSPGPLSAADMRMLDNMIGNAISIRSFRRGPEFVQGQLEGAMEFINSKITSTTALYPKVQVPRIPSSEIPEDLVIMMRDEFDFTEQQVRDQLFDMGYDVGANRYVPVREAPISSTPSSILDNVPPEVLPQLMQYIQGLAGGGR